MLNLYADVAAFRRRFANSATLDSGDQVEVLRVLEAASREIDDYTRRTFYAETATRYFDGNGRAELWLPLSKDGDLLSVTTLKVDEDGDGVYELTLAANTDYWLWPDNVTPKNRIDINLNSTQLSAFPCGRRRVEIVGSWGYTAATEIPAATLNEDLDSSEVGVDVAAGTGALFEVGQTILIDAEQMYISAIATDTLTVTRGVNGTTAAAHTDTNQLIYRYVYIPEVAEAALIQAGRLWKRREAAYANIIQNPLTGGMEMIKGMDPDVMALLSGVRLRAV